MSLVCPQCRTADNLWRGVEVEAWQAIGDDLEPGGDGQRDVEGWEHARATGDYGCAKCDIELHRGDFVRLSEIDGEPLAGPIPGQLTIDDAAEAA